jgi:hypothetical protein
MKQTRSIEEFALGLSGLLLLEAVGLELAHSETLGATIGVFAAAAIACVLKRLAVEPRS